MRNIFPAALFLLLFPLLSHAQPVIVFDRPNYDFAAIGQTDKVEHFFEFHNAGDRELVIEKVTAS